VPRSERHVRFAGLLAQMLLLTSVWKRQQNADVVLFEKAVCNNHGVL
jgi:hypothetical protein